MNAMRLVIKYAPEPLGFKFWIKELGDLATNRTQAEAGLRRI